MDIAAWIGRAARARRRGNCLVGCGVALAVALVLLIVAGVVVALNWRGWAATGMDKAVDAMLEDVPVDEAEKAETRAVVDDFIGRFEAGDVTLAQFAAVMQAVGESPLMPAGVALGAGRAYFDESGLTEAEREDGRVQLERVAHGVADQTISTDELSDLLRPLHAATGDTEVWQFNLRGRMLRLKAPEITTDEQLRALIESARASADAHGLPASPPTFDLSGELDRAIRRATEGDADADTDPDADQVSDPQPAGGPDEPGAADPAGAAPAP